MRWLAKCDCTFRSRASPALVSFHIYGQLLIFNSQQKSFPDWQILITQFCFIWAISKDFLVQSWMYFCGSGFARICCTENFDTISFWAALCFQILQEFITEANGTFISRCSQMFDLNFVDGIVALLRPKGISKIVNPSL